MITIEVNGRKLEAEEGSTIIEVADQAGIYIPRFCNGSSAVKIAARVCFYPFINQTISWTYVISNYIFWFTICYISYICYANFI